jgi:hypothetical protein
MLGSFLFVAASQESGCIAPALLGALGAVYISFNITTLFYYCISVFPDPSPFLPSHSHCNEEYYEVGMVRDNPSHELVVPDPLPFLPSHSNSARTR